MNFKIKKEKLLNVLQIVDKAVSQNTPKPSLKGVLIESFQNKIVFITSDLHISIKTELTNLEDFEIKEEGKILLDEKILIEISRKIESEYINFETMDGNLIAVYGGDSKFQLNTIDFESYPEINFDSLNSRFNVKSCILKSIIEKTAYACSEKEIHPNLTGVNLFSKLGKLHASATDQFRFSRKTFDIDFQDEFNIIVPKKYFINAVQCIGENESVDIEIQSTKILFFINETIITVELVEDLFPNITNIFNQSIIGSLIINRSKLSKMIERCSLIKDEKNNSVVRINIKNNKLKLTSTNNISSAVEEIDIDKYKGEDVEILFSSKFLQDALKVIDTEDVMIQFSGALKPIFVKNIDDESLIMLISPQRP